MAHTHRTGPRTSIAIIGGETLLGKEVNELLEARKIPANIQLVASIAAEDSDKVASVLALGEEEPIVMGSIESSDLASARIVSRDDTRFLDGRMLEQHGLDLGRPDFVS